MITAIIRLGQLALTVNGSAKFPSPNDESIVEQSSLFEILDQRCTGLIRLTSQRFDSAGKPP